MKAVGVMNAGLVQVWIDEMREVRDVRVRLVENIWMESEEEVLWRGVLLYLMMMMMRELPTAPAVSSIICQCLR